MKQGRTSAALHALSLVITITPFDWKVGLQGDGLFWVAFGPFQLLVTWPAGGEE